MNCTLNNLIITILKKKYITNLEFARANPPKRLVIDISSLALLSFPFKYAIFKDLEPLFKPYFFSTTKYL